MQSVLRNLFVLSRPRFWLYVLGPFFLGSVAASLDVWMNPMFWVLFAYFLFPANVLLYGVNDYFDRDTDKYSSKKAGKEFVFSGGSWVLWAWGSSLVLGVVLAFVTHWSLLAYLALAVAYSAPPLRFKKRPVIDSLSNCLYVAPGVFAYLYFGDAAVNWSFVLAGCLWAAAMHLYSAVPDITADKKAGLKTTAVVFGAKSSLLLCALLWYGATVLTDLLVGYLYVLVAVLVYSRPEIVEKVYWYFPYLNGVVGFYLFISIIL
jgi:4-hydroxybenzoate polyprenyltransferase